MKCNQFSDLKPECSSTAVTHPCWSNRTCPEDRSEIELSLSAQTHAFFTPTYGTKHDGERGSVLEVVTGPDTLARVLGQELQIGSTALESLLHLDLVLHNERFSLRKGVNGLVEHGRDGVVSSL